MEVSKDVESTYHARGYGVAVMFCNELESLMSKGLEEDLKKEA
jgi:hypothetical protein